MNKQEYKKIVDKHSPKENKEKNRKGTGKADEKGAKSEKKEEKRESRIFIYTSDFIGSDLRRRVSFDSVKESSKP